MNVKQLLNEIKAPSIANRFEVEINVPIVLKAQYFANKALGGKTDSPDDLTFRTLAKSTSFPGKSISTVNVIKQGRTYPIRGVAEFDHTWDVTFYNTADLDIKWFFEDWMYQIDRHDSLLYRTPFINNYLGTTSVNSGYMTNLKVKHISTCEGKDSQPEFELVHSWPSRISDVQLSADSKNVTEFTVTFHYDYWERVPNQGIGGFMSKVFG